jgi:hypothetical protein
MSDITYGDSTFGGISRRDASFGCREYIQYPDFNCYEKQLKNILKKFNIKYNHIFLRKIINYIYNSELKALSNPLYLKVLAENIPYTKYPTYNDNLKKLVNKAYRFINIFNRNKDNYDIIDTWSKLANNWSLYIFKDISNYNFPNKRFISIKLNLEEFLNKKLSDQYGYILENYIVYSLNKNEFKCPICKTKGSISLCIDCNESLDSFRDAVCGECYKNGIYTIYEIKTRNKNMIDKNIVIKNNELNSFIESESTNLQKCEIYSGDYLSINTFLKINYSVYILLYARDTGDIYIGKIINKKLRPNEKFLYSLQEGFECASISSNVICNIEYITNIGISDNFLTVKESDELSKNALKIVLSN